MKTTHSTPLYREQGAASWSTFKGLDVVFTPKYRKLILGISPLVILNNGNVRLIGQWLNNQHKYVFNSNRHGLSKRTSYTHIKYVARERISVQRCADKALVYIAEQAWRVSS